MRIPKDEYKKAKSCLFRYNYNCLNILMIKSNIPEISAINYDGMPKGKYNINDIVSNTIIQLEDNKELQKSIKEHNIVIKALEIVGRDSQYIFEHFFNKKDMTKWDIIDKLCVSEETYKRRYRELIYAVYEVMKKN